MDVVVTLVFALVFLAYLHELGHLCVAKLTGIPVRRMYLGFGPTLKTKTIEETEYVFGMFLGASMQPDWKIFREEPAFRRLLVSSAGPASTFIAAFVFLAIAYCGFHTPAKAIVGEVDSDGLAYQSGIRTGDQIIAVDGTHVNSWSDFGIHMISRVGDTGSLTLDIRRNDNINTHLFPIAEWQSDVAWVNMYRYFGFHPFTEQEERTSFSSGIVQAGIDTVRIFWSTAMSGFRMVFGSMSISNFVGGMQLTQLGAEGKDLNFDDYLKLLALFALGSTVINLLPGPIVDGLAIITAGVEWLWKTRLPTLVDKVGFYVGSVLAYGPIPICAVHELIRIFG